MTTTYTATPVGFTEDEIARVVFNDDGLVPAIVQDATDGAVLMLAWMNEESLRKTLQTGRTWFWSRSRQEYWCKGETSGDRQWVRRVSYDCDGDALLVAVDQEGAGACHTGARSCFYREFGGSGSGTPAPGVASVDAPVAGADDAGAAVAGADDAGADDAGIDAATVESADVAVEGS